MGMAKRLKQHTVREVNTYVISKNESLNCLGQF